MSPSILLYCASLFCFQFPGANDPLVISTMKEVESEENKIRIEYGIICDDKWIKLEQAISLGHTLRKHSKESLKKTLLEARDSFEGLARDLDMAQDHSVINGLIPNGTRKDGKIHFQSPAKRDAFAGSTILKIRLAESRGMVMDRLLYYHDFVIGLSPLGNAQGTEIAMVEFLGPDKKPLSEANLPATASWCRFPANQLPMVDLALLLDPIHEKMYFPRDPYHVIAACHHLGENVENGPGRMALLAEQVEFLERKVARAQKERASIEVMIELRYELQICKSLLENRQLPTKRVLPDKNFPVINRPRTAIFGPFTTPGGW
jgi:hypothetical protein